MDSVANAITWPVAVSNVRFLVAIRCRVNFLGPVNCWYLKDRVLNFRSPADAALARSQISSKFESLINLSNSSISASADKRTKVPNLLQVGVASLGVSSFAGV